MDYFVRPLRKFWSGPNFDIVYNCDYDNSVYIWIFILLFFSYFSEECDSNLIYLLTVNTQTNIALTQKLKR